MPSASVLEVVVTFYERRRWLRRLLPIVARWRWLLNVVLWLMPVDASLAKRNLARWRLHVRRDGWLRIREV